MFNSFDMTANEQTEYKAPMMWWLLRMGITQSRNWFVVPNLIV